MSAISIQHLTKTYKAPKGDVHAINDLSFTIQKGEFFGLLGPNGAGKSTLINILSGVTQKTGGTVDVLGTSIDTDHTSVKKMIGVVPQEITFDVFFSVERALRYQFGYYGLSVDEKHLEYILSSMALADKRNTKPRELSGGMKRRFMIAKALVHKPQILVLDEPTAGVDVELRHDLYDVVRTLNKEGVTIILTSHYLEEVELLCERVAIINKGKLVALDNKHDLKDRFQSTRQFSIALSDSLKKIPDILKPFHPIVNENELTLTFDEHEYDRVLQAVAQAKLPVAHFRVIEPSLEDVFVSLTASKK